MSNEYHFDTQQIHAGAVPDPTTGARQVPIYQTTAYVFRDADHAARLFALKELGYIYSRLNNPTITALQDRITALEGGAGTVCCASGHGAQFMAMFPLMSPGKNIVASTRIYGGSMQQFTNSFRKFGWGAKAVDFTNLDAIKAAIDENTRALFCETLANPAGDILELPEIAKIADAAGIPLVVDNTSATPWLCRPIEYGATLVVHSMTKYLTGNGTVMGGSITDSGKFNWSASDKFPSLSEPEPAYHGLKFYEAFGPLAYTFYGIAVGLRDLGIPLNPQAAHYTLMGIETLSLRMAKHVENATKVATWLEKNPHISKVNYAGLPSSPFYERIQRLTPRGAGALFTFHVKGGYDACVKLVDNVKLFSHVANLGDTRSLIIHPASTTHSQLSPEQLVAAGAGPDVVRVSIGIEDPADIIADLDQALTAASA